MTKMIINLKISIAISLKCNKFDFVLLSMAKSFFSPILNMQIILFRKINDAFVEVDLQKSPLAFFKSFCFHFLSSLKAAGVIPKIV